MKTIPTAIHMAAVLLLGVTGPALAQDPVKVTANNYVRGDEWLGNETSNIVRT